MQRWENCDLVAAATIHSKLPPRRERLRRFSPVLGPFRFPRALVGVASVITKANFASMSVEELWGIYDEISKLLEVKMLADKRMLEQRLISLRPATAGRLKARRPYPPVLPKFANPDEPSQVWAGRGKRPRWVIEKLATGLVLEDLSIGRGSSVAMPEEHLIGEIAFKKPETTQYPNDSVA